MNEASFSMNFLGYNNEGIAAQITIRGESFDHFTANINALLGKYPSLGGMDILTPQPVDRALRPQKVHVAAWLRGETSDKSGKVFPCVFLYGDAQWLQYSVATIYYEDLNKLPDQVNWEEARSVGNGAPPVDKARNYWNVCDFNILLVPKIQPDGEVEMGRTGKPRMRFFGVVDGDGNIMSHPEPPAQQAQSPQYASQPAGRTQPPLMKNQPTQNNGVASNDALHPYAVAYDEMEDTLEDETKGFVCRMRQLDRASEGVLTVDGSNADGTRRVGQYEYLAGVIDQLGKQMTGYGDMHKEVLTFILGRPIHKGALPGDRMRVLFDEIWEGNKGRGNPKMQVQSRDIMASVHYLVRNIYDEHGLAFD